MNNLLTESFERIIGRYPGEKENDSRRFSIDAKDLGLKDFYEEVGELDKQIEQITTQLHKLQAANEESQSVTKVSEMKEIKQRMEKDVEQANKVALGIKTSLEELDRNNLLNRQKSGYRKGTAVDLSRVGMTLALKKKLKERMSEFQELRQSIQEEYREVVVRRVFTVTGTTPDEELVDQLIETGKSEQIFQKAIQGRGEIEETMAEIQERHDAVLELEKKLMDLQQMFLDMSLLIDARGDLLNDIESQVLNAADHVEKGKVKIQEAKKKQKKSRKNMCLAIILLLIFIIVVLSRVFKDVKFLD